MIDGQIELEVSLGARDLQVEVAFDVPQGVNSSLSRLWAERSGYFRQTCEEFGEFGNANISHALVPNPAKLGHDKAQTYFQSVFGVFAATLESELCNFTPIK